MTEKMMPQFDRRKGTSLGNRRGDESGFKHVSLRLWLVIHTHK